MTQRQNDIAKARFKITNKGGNVYSELEKVKGQNKVLISSLMGMRRSTQQSLGKRNEIRYATHVPIHHQGAFAYQEVNVLRNAQYGIDLRFNRLELYEQGVDNLIRILTKTVESNVLEVFYTDTELQKVMEHTLRGR